MTLPVNSAREVRVSNIFASVKATLMLPIVWLSLYYSVVLKMEINTRSTLHLLNAQVAGERRESIDEMGYFLKTMVSNCT